MPGTTQELSSADRAGARPEWATTPCRSAGGMELPRQTVAPVPEIKAGVATTAPQSTPDSAACRLLFAAWLCYLLFAPTLGFDWIESWHNEQRALELILLGGTAAVFVFAMTIPAFRARLPRLQWPILAILALGCLSATRAPFPAAAFAEIALHMLLVVLIMVAAATVAADPERGQQAVRHAALLLLGAYVAGVTARYASAVAMRDPLSIDVALFGYANPRFPSALHALLMPFVAALAIDAAQRRSVRAAAFTVLALIWTINLALGTRAIWFAYGAAFGTLWLLPTRRCIGALARATGAAALVGIAGYLLLFKLLPAWSGIGEHIAQRSLDQLMWGSNRELLIRSSVDAILGSPWLGLGPMQFAAIPGVWAAHPHNWILQLGSEWGLPALLLALYALGRTVRRLVAQIAPVGASGSPAAVVPLCAGLIALYYGLVDGNLVMPVSQSAAAIVFGCVLGSVGARSRTSPEAVAGPRRSTAPRRLWIAIALVAATAQLFWFTLQTLPAAMEREATHRVYAPEMLWPRFWSDGFVAVRKP